MIPLFALPMGMEWILLIVVAVLIFGGSRLAGLGKGAGQAIREFKEETRRSDSELPPGTEGTASERQVNEQAGETTSAPKPDGQ